MRNRPSASDGVEVVSGTLASAVNTAASRSCPVSRRGGPPYRGDPRIDLAVVYRLALHTVINAESTTVWEPNRLLKHDIACQNETCSPSVSRIWTAAVHEVELGRLDRFLKDVEIHPAGSKTVLRFRIHGREPHRCAQLRGPAVSEFG